MLKTEIIKVFVLWQIPFFVTGEKFPEKLPKNSRPN